MDDTHLCSSHAGSLYVGLGIANAIFFVLAKGRCSYLVSLTFPKAIVVAGPVMLFSSFGELPPSPRLHRRIYTLPKFSAQPLMPPHFSQLSRRKVKSPRRAISDTCEVVGVGVTSSVHRGLAL
jgi:hypothetical protein